MTKTFKRGLTAGAVALAIASAGTLVPAAAATSPTTSPARHGAHWLATQQAKGLVTTYSSFGTLPDYGLTADLGVALKTIGGSHRALAKVEKAFAGHVASYTTGVDYGSSDVYAGATAKALFFAQTTGAKARDFGGLNLVTQLNRRVSTVKGIAGRIQDKSAYGDYANTIGQSYAAVGLARARSHKAASTMRFLLKQQCRAGFFRLDFASPTATKQTCDAGSKALSAPDTDVTALTVINLETIRKPGPRVRAAINRASRWLARHQARNGSFTGGPTTATSNANSTGLAARALALSGRCAPARDAARWVVKLQRDNGAIGYDKAAFNAAKKSGITKVTRDQWRRATTQAAPALRYLNRCQ